MTTKKPATRAKKTTKQYDFDAYDPALEDDLIDQISAAAAVDRYIITAEGTLIAELPSGVVVKATLRPSAEALGDLSKPEVADLPPIEQFAHVFRAIGEEEQVKLLLAEPIDVAASFAQLYFEKFEKLQKASVGE